MEDKAAASLKLRRRRPSHVVKRGKTPILSPEEARELFSSVPTDTLIGLRDRALIGVLIYSFASHHEMPVHHTLEEYLDAYIEAAGLWEDKKGPLFRATNGKTGILSARPLDREDAFHMIRRRARQAGIETKIGCHTFRATGITIYLTNGGDLEKAQQMAAHESPRTTKLYDRRSDVVSLDEVEKVVF